MGESRSRRVPIVAVDAEDSGRCTRTVRTAIGNPNHTENTHRDIRGHTEIHRNMIRTKINQKEIEKKFEKQTIKER
jgi:hypothetical protein